MAAKLRLLISPHPPTLSSRSTSFSSPAPSNCSFPFSNRSFCPSSYILNNPRPPLPPFPHLRSVLFSSAATATADKKQAPEFVSGEFSSTRLLAQNVPWTSTADDIRALFEKHGTVVDVELSMHNKMRNRGLAFVEMGSAEEAAVALNKLEAYEFEGRILKLNYAKPKGKKASPEKPKQPIVFNIYVANLSFAARAHELKEFFMSNGHKAVSAGVVFQGTPRRSAGYGFVSFATKREADAAVSFFHGKEFMGREIQVARSKRFVKVVNEQDNDCELLEEDNDS